MSDVLATAWVLVSVLAALVSRRRPQVALLCGAAFGIAVLVRPTNILLAPSLVFALPSPGRYRAYVRVFLGGLPFAILLLVYNKVCHGSPWLSGYGAIFGSFTTSVFPERVRHYAYWLAVLGTPLPILGWLGIGAVGGVRRTDRAMLILWFAVFFLFYAFYEPDSAWWYTRFLLPGIPAMILALLLVLERGFAYKGLSLLCLEDDRLHLPRHLLREGQ